VGFNLHHIDGNNSNTIDENLALLCVEDHDVHHRQIKYPKHIELGPEKIKELKISWESFVKESQKGSPITIAVISLYGTMDSIHSAKIIFQWPNEKIEFERSFHLLQGPPDKWIDEMLEEVKSIGDNLAISLIDEVFPIEYCPCCSGSLSNTLKEGVVLRETSSEWKTDSIASIYINPITPSLAINISLGAKAVFSASLHLCQNSKLHLHCEYFDESVPIKRNPSIRTQATTIIDKLLKEWRPARILIGTGNPDRPELIEELRLPRVWEMRD
jgi:hypothetical protein